MDEWIWDEVDDWEDDDTWEDYVPSIIIRKENDNGSILCTHNNQVPQIRR